MKAKIQRQEISPNHVLLASDMQERLSQGKDIWLQLRHHPYGRWVHTEKELYGSLTKDNPKNTPADWLALYGIWWRCWLINPTEKEKSSVMWIN